MKPIRFSQTSVHGALEVLFDQQTEILNLLKGPIMSRGDEIKAEVETLRTEQAETAASAEAALARVGVKVDALTALVESLTAGQVTDTELAEIKAAAAEVKAAADAEQAKLDAVEPPTPPSA